MRLFSATLIALVGVLICFAGAGLINYGFGNQLVASVVAFLWHALALFVGVSIWLLGFVLALSAVVAPDLWTNGKWR